MQFQFEKYDLTLAVVSRRTLLYEMPGHSNEDRANLVWKPQQEFLEHLAAAKPKQITCFFGNQFRFPNEECCACRHLYAVNPLNHVAYLGTILNNRSIECYRSRLPKQFRRFISETKISRGRLVYCIIPVGQETIDELAIMQAAKRFFASFPAKTLIPELADDLICLLSEELGSRLDKEILRLAKKTARAVSKQEKLKKFMEDLF